MFPVSFLPVYPTMLIIKGPIGRDEQKASKAGTGRTGLPQWWTVRWRRCSVGRSGRTGWGWNASRR